MPGQPVDPEGGGFALLGKLPALGDFVRLNVPARTAATLDQWLEGGLAGLRAEEPSPAAASVAEGPAWRWAMDAGVAGPQALAGVMAPSRDAAGRRFPCLAFFTADEDSPATELTADAAWFDAVEAALGAAVSSGRPPAALAAELEEVGPPRAPDPAGFVVKARATADGVFMDVQGGPDLRDEALAAAWTASPPPSGSSLWWRHEAARTLAVSVPGLPRADALGALLRAPAAADAAASRAEERA